LGSGAPRTDLNSIESAQSCGNTHLLEGHRQRDSGWVSLAISSTSSLWHRIDVGEGITPIINLLLIVFQLYGSSAHQNSALFLMVAYYWVFRHKKNPRK